LRPQRIDLLYAFALAFLVATLGGDLLWRLPNYALRDARTLFPAPKLKFGPYSAVLVLQRLEKAILRSEFYMALMVEKRRFIRNDVFVWHFVSLCQTK
jgi:hypothetical protein